MCEAASPLLGVWLLLCAFAFRRLLPCEPLSSSSPWFSPPAVALIRLLPALLAAVLALSASVSVRRLAPSHVLLPVIAAQLSKDLAYTMASMLVENRRARDEESRLGAWQAQ